MFASRSDLAPLRSFLRDASAMAAVEFAFVAPMVIGFLLMIAQIGLYMYDSASLSRAVNNAAREIMVGKIANTAGVSADTFRTQYLCPLLPGSMSCSDIVTNVITVPSTGTFYGLPTPQMDNSKTSFCIGQPGSYVIVEVYYAMPVLGIPTMLATTSSYNGHLALFINANSVFVNEPFTTSYSGC